jgi:hypothetical protein
VELELELLREVLKCVCGVREVVRALGGVEVCVGEGEK